MHTNKNWFLKFLFFRSSPVLQNSLSFLDISPHTLWQYHRRLTKYPDEILFS